MALLHWTSIRFCSSRIGGVSEQCASVIPVLVSSSQTDWFLRGPESVLKFPSGVRNNGTSGEAFLFDTLQQCRACCRTRRGHRHPRAVRSARHPRVAPLHSFRVPQATSYVSPEPFMFILSKFLHSHLRLCV